MINQTRIESVRNRVLQQVKKLEPILKQKYEAAVTPWLVRIMLEEDAKEPTTGAATIKDIRRELKIET